MEDEQGDVGPVSVTVSKSSLSGKLASELPVEKTGGEGQLEEFCEEGDGGEVMVEVMGSDVFVEGVIGQKEGHLGIGVIGDLGGNVEKNREETGVEAMEVLDEGDGSKGGGNEVGVEGSRDERNFNVSEAKGVDVGVNESVNVGNVVGDGNERFVGCGEVAGSEGNVGKGEDIGVSAVDVLDERDGSKSGESEAGVEPSRDEQDCNVLELQGVDVGFKESVDVGDGVDNGKEKFLGCGKVGHLEGNEEKNGNDSEVKPMEVLDDENRSKSMGTEEVGVEGSRGKQNCNVLESEGVDIGFRESVDVGDAVSDGKKGFEGCEEFGGSEVNVGKNGEEIGVSAMDVSNTEDGEKLMENEVGGLKLESVCNGIAMEDVDAGVGESVDSGGGLDSGKGGFVGSKEVRDLKNDAGKNAEETGVNSMDVSSEGDGIKMQESEVRVDVLRGEEDNRIVTNEVNGGISESIGVGDGAVSKPLSKGVSILDNEVLTNTGSEAVVVPPSAVTGDTSGHTEEVMSGNREVNHEEKEMENEAVDKSGADFMTSEHLNHPIPMEAPNELKIYTAEKEELVTSNDGATVCVDSGVDSMTAPVAADSAGGTKDTTSDVSPNSNSNSADNAVINGIGGGVEESGLVNDTEGGALDMGNPNDEVFVENMEVASTHGDCGTETKFVDEKVLAVESEDSICKTHPIGVQDEIQGSLKESHGIMSEPNHGIEDTHEKSLSGVSGETNLVHQHHGLLDEGSVESETKYDGMEVDSLEPRLGTTENTSKTGKIKLPNKETRRPTSFVPMNQSGYVLLQENDGHFTRSDLVWGKVHSHPWWPGQIFDPEDASEAAVKYRKKDSYLVAYFGDRTFAWNDASVLKPFRPHFSQIEKQSNSAAFQNAVDCALDEVGRRVELGLACSCIPKDVYRKIECQIVENSGIREESIHRYGVDRSTGPVSFEPDKFLEYVSEVAPCASFGADRLDLVITRAQLTAFYRFKGCRLLAEFPSSGELLENEADTEQISCEKVTSKEYKHAPEDGSCPQKERTLIELMGDGAFYPDIEDESVAEDQGKSVSISSGRKRKANDALADGSAERLPISVAKLPSPTSKPPKPSFKIGECIRRVASQLTAPVPLVKENNDEKATDGCPHISELSTNEILRQLELLALNPKKRPNLQGNVHNFFLGFRSSISLNRRGQKRKGDGSVGTSAEEFEFDEVTDSYWMDRIVHNYPVEQLSHDAENGGGCLPLVPFGEGKHVKSGRKLHSRKRYSTGNYPTETPESDEIIKLQKQQSSPAELILNFAEKGRVPSEINLNKMFRRFGSLMESETEVDHESGRAKVIFKRGSDAIVARSSAEKFNIFGPVLVNYEIGYSPIISVKILPFAIPQLQETEALDDIAVL